ncbi:MAG: glycoside hydrolase family 47 protein, partial [bacterium]
MASQSANSQSSAGAIKIDKVELAQRVQQEFLHAWNAYKQFAWGHDELKPLSKSYRDWHAVSLYMTPVDAMDTMILMGLTDEAAKTKEFVVKNLS